MKADELYRRILDYGADAGGLNDRFAGDAELYKLCFDEFIVEENFETLRVAISEKDYKRAFAAAHALKGLAGNLGLNDFGSAIHTLVESLRNESYSNIDSEYAETDRQHKRLLALSAGEDFVSGGGSIADGSKPPVKRKKPKKKPDSPMIAVLVILFITVLLICLMFYRVIGRYRDNTAFESANHLIELNHQVKSYIEGKIASDWRTAYSFADTLSDGDFISNDSEIFELMRRKIDIWDVSDICVYTQSGRSATVGGYVEPDVFSANLASRVRADGAYGAVNESNLIYAVPVDTPITLNGERVTAVSVAQSMKSFLDDMGFESFGGAASIYLTKSDGTVIGSLSESLRSRVKNISAILDGLEIEGLMGSGFEDASPFTGEGAYLISGPEGRGYLVSTPITTTIVPMRLFYLVPEAAVNETMSSFSSQLILLSIVMIIVFAVIAVLIFLFFYRIRKKRFDAEIRARDTMFDQLIKHTNTAFGLFNTGERTPRFISSNSVDLLDDEGWMLDRDETGYHWHDSKGEHGEIINRVNEKMRGWDGKSDFKSGYIINDAVTPPKYFEIRLYPTGGGEDFVGMALDVTEAQEREEGANAALEQAREANAAKSVFLSNMSHDIRTPMNAIINMAEFAKESALNPKEQQTYLDTIIESSHHLLNLINDILDMSRIDSGKIAIASEPFDIKKAIAIQNDIIRSLCSVKHQTFIADLDGVKTRAVLGDELKFSQIIANLLSNAMKFTPDYGAIRITASELTSDGDSSTVVRVSVEDTGCGISADYLPHIFDVFSRADKTRVSQIEGSGLGLSICKGYLDAMGGAIYCESEEGEGSVFTVEMRFDKADAALGGDESEETRSDSTFVGMRCLVAEDIATNQRIAKILLERLGFVTDIAGDGLEAVDMFLDSRPGYYDVIYMDIQMPVMDGYEAAKAIRASAHSQARSIPIISMTANVFTEDAEKARLAGMNGHIGKPIRSSELLKTTKKALSGDGGFAGGKD